jgi:mannose-6-phosphate isomerase-like protein (cupin superfamily)/DNA-binding XRE family transcriptional regulator
MSREPASAGTANGAAPLVGARLREKRADNGISLRELARRLDVSPSLVSQIETGKIQPSVRTLYAIVSELGLSLDEIFELVDASGASATAVAPVELAPAARATATAPTPPPQGVTEPRSVGAATVGRADERRVIELESGVRWERMAAWEDPGAEFMIAVYGVGGSSSADGKLMRHRGREFGLVLSGTLNVTVGFEDHVLGPGDSITFQSTTPHRLHNDGPVEVRAVWVTLGRYGPE